MNDIKGSKYLIVFIILTLALLSTLTIVVKSFSSSDPSTIYEASIRKGELPIMNSFNGKSFIKNTLAAQSDLSDLKLISLIPVDFHKSEFWKALKFELKSQNKSLPITIIPEES